ncbi:MAG TPA: MFS transporter [Vicinamibacterales bacterium]|nr:MFS transporter [Vicinamibacterales bacterium]
MPTRGSRHTAVTLVTLAAFTDILAYSIAVPVLPDLSRRLGASPTTIGFLFAAFGISLLVVSIPAGTMSDRIGRRAPLAGGAVAIAVSTVLFAFATSLPWLFVARLVQGAADAVTWVVGFALIADLYDADERGRVMGLVMSATTAGFMVGPTLGGWLYELGGPAVPYLAVAALAAVSAVGFAWMATPPSAAIGVGVPLRRLLRVPAVAVCAAAVVLGSATLAMLEPTFALFLSDRLALLPSRIGLVFGVGAIVGALLHPVFGRVADRTGGRRLMLAGLVCMGAMLPLLALSSSFRLALGLEALFAVGVAMMATPSLAFMGEATTSAGVGSFGVAYGLYNVCWAIGLLVGPAVGGAMYERVGFAALAQAWAVAAVGLTLLIARAPVGSAPRGGV